MKIDIYKSTKNGTKYLSVPEGTVMEELNLPVDTNSDFLALSPFKSSIDIIHGQSRIALDEDDVINQIKEKGYATHQVTTEIRISTTQS